MIVKNFKAEVLSSTVLSFRTSVKARVVFFIVDLVEFPDEERVVVSDPDPVHV